MRHQVSLSDVPDGAVEGPKFPGPSTDFLWWIELRCPPNTHMEGIAYDRELQITAKLKPRSYEMRRAIEFVGVDEHVFDHQTRIKAQPHRGRRDGQPNAQRPEREAIDTCLADLG